jgi:FixJ family two-component response regulator
MMVAEGLLNKQIAYELMFQKRPLKPMSPQFSEN